MGCCSACGFGVWGWPMMNIMSNEFAYPWVLWFGFVVPLVWLVGWFFDRRRCGVESSVPGRILAAGSSFRVRFRWVPMALMSIGLFAGIVGLARPREAISDQKSTQDAIAIELVIDRSGSMREEAYFGGVETTRLEAVKKVVEQFVVGDGDQLGGREGDLIGLIVFGTYADTMMPLTQSHEALVEAIRRVEIPGIQSEQSTAIGDALVLACARLKASEDSIKMDLDDPDFEMKSKAIILLTDGENRAGMYSPMEAAGLASDWGIKVYIVGIQGKENNLFAGFGRSIGQQVNDQNMTKVALATGGLYWGVDSLDDLLGVYSTIDELERTEIQITESTRFEERYHPFAVASLMFLFAGYCWSMGLGREVG